MSLDLAKPGLTDPSLLRANIDADLATGQTTSKTAQVGSNGGTAAGQAGSYDQVAKRIRAFAHAGAGLFMLQFQRVKGETRHFATKVVQLVPRL